MKYHSTGGSTGHTLDEVLLGGIAEDGGLYVPDSLPEFAIEDFDEAQSICDIARILLLPFFSTSALREAIDDIVAETFHFPIQLSKLDVSDDNAWMLELYHGPTAAFKDVGAGFLAACLSRLVTDVAAPLTILVATSGDTGGAVAAAFDQRPEARVIVLFPDGRVSERQHKQLTCWSDNVLSIAVKGSFDDCQAMAKAAFSEQQLFSQYRFSSANSINIGRLLPQSIYYAYASLTHYRSTGQSAGFIIPVGNLGNSLACIMARDMGLPIGDIMLASNANRLIPDYLSGEKWLPRDSIQTLANAMDVGNPSNMERLRDIHGESDKLKEIITAVSVSDEEIERQIRDDFEQWGFATCPHTATATHLYRQLEDAQKIDDWIIVATAHPAKFELIVEPLIGQSVPIPDDLAAILSKPSRFRVIEADLEALSQAMNKNFQVDAGRGTGDK